MFIVKILKRLLPRFSQLDFKVVPLNLAVVLQVDADGKIPSRNIPGLPNDDYDLLVGELIIRFHEKVIKTNAEK